MISKGKLSSIIAMQSIKVNTIGIKAKDKGGVSSICLPPIISSLVAALLMIRFGDRAYFFIRIRNFTMGLGEIIRLMGFVSLKLDKS